MSINEHGLKHAPDLSDSFTIVFFGRHCRLSMVPLRRIVAADISVSAVFLPSKNELGPAVRRITGRPTIPLGTNHPVVAAISIDQLAIEHGIPVYGIRRPLADDLESILRDSSPDLIVISCFPWRIPRRIRQTAKFGAINMHPSLLPRFRGPDPLFWAFQTGSTEWGVTVHQVCHSLDAGPIVEQSEFGVRDGMSGDELETLAADRGADLLLSVVKRIRDGTFTATSQNESHASYLGFPGNSDLLIQRTWPVKRALNFVSGVVTLGYPPLVETVQGTFEVLTALASQNIENETDETWLSRDVVRIALTDGVMDLKVREHR